MDLQDWMNHNGIGDDELGEQVGSTRSYISRVRRGQVQPNLALALNIWERSGRVVDLDSMLPEFLRAPYRLRWMPDSVRKRPARRASKSREAA